MNYHVKRKATLNDVTTWQQYKHARNETNNAIRTAKRQHFKNNLEFNKKNLILAFLAVLSLILTQ